MDAFIYIYNTHFRGFGKPCDCERYTGATSGYQSGCLEVFGPSIDIDNNINMSELKLYDGDNDSDEKYLKDDLENENKQL